jgi:hypothetical protein
MKRSFKPLEFEGIRNQLKLITSSMSGEEVCG